MPCGPVCAASIPVVVPQTRHGSVLIQARYLGLRDGCILLSMSLCQSDLLTTPKLGTLD